MKGFTETRRDKVMEVLKAQNIDSRPAFYPIHHMEFYRHDDFFRTTPANSVLVSQEGISLPTFIGLGDNDISFIAETLIGSLNH
jgi:dTDP-4-amino-4,6-dideoxygalactose transaminase